MAGPGHHHGRRFADQASKAKVAKAGKRSGAYRTPPMPNPDNAARRAAGERQFTSPRALTVEVAGITGKPRAVTVPFLYDPNRKRAVLSPANKPKEASA